MGEQPFLNIRKLRRTIGSLNCLAYGNCSKISNTFLSLFSNKMLVFRAGIHKMFVRIANSILFKLLTLSTNSVTKKIIAVRTAYFYNWGPIFAAKKLWQSLSQSEKLYEDILVRSGKMWAEKGCITFWVKMKKHREISTYFCLKHCCGRSQPFFRTVYPNRNHVTTHPDMYPEVSSTMRVLAERSLIGTYLYS